MPPVFGIVQPIPAPDRNKIKRMADAATYHMARRLITQDHGGLSVAAAVRNNSVTKEDTGMFSESGNHVIVADACLYNRHEILYRLGIDKKIEMGDAALILKAYEKWGDQCLKFLYGDFAFVIYDTQSRDIFCGRDPMGVRPFFYTWQENTFIFSSELRIVLAGLDRKPEPDPDYLHDSLAGIKSRQDLSPYENIFRLPPAHFLLLKKDKIQVTRYWLPDEKSGIHLKTENEYTEMFRELLVNAVNMRSSGVSSLGSELSGGLDSSAVTGISADHAVSGNIPFHTFSNVFPENTGLEFKDEREFIWEMNCRKNLKGINIDGLGIPVIELLKQTLDVQGVFVQQNYNVFNYGLFKAAADAGTEVLLSGFGGDELVSARVSVPWNELINGRQWQIIRAELFHQGITLKSVLKPGVLAARYLYSRIYHPEYRAGVFTPDLLDKRLDNLPLNRSYAEQHQLAQRFRDKYKTPFRENLSSRQLWRISRAHIPQRMEYCYSAGAQFGIEYRYPLLDVNLILACLAFPPWMKQHLGVNRYLFREAISGFVPESIRLRNDKSGSTIPHTYFSLVREKEQILGLIQKCSGIEFLSEIFDFSRFPSWYEKLVKREEHDLNYLNPGMFYTYLMIMLYYSRENRE